MVLSLLLRVTEISLGIDGQRCRVWAGPESGCGGTVISMLGWN